MTESAVLLCSSGPVGVPVGSRMNVNERRRSQTIDVKNPEKTRAFCSPRALITVWLQVRVLPGPPAFAREASEGCRAEANGEGGPLSRELRLGKPVPQAPSEASEGCRAEARQGAGGLVPFPQKYRKQPHAK